MNTCTKVFLRKKEISGDRISLYLDFYPPIRNPHTNRLSRRESLGIYLYGHPSNAREREFNASMMEKAEAIRCRRFEQFLNEQFGFLDKEKLRMDFLEYFRKKCFKKYQKWKSFTSTSRTVNTHSKVGQDAHSKWATTGSLTVDIISYIVYGLYISAQQC